MMVPRDGLEPSLPKKMDFESIVSTNSTTAAKLFNLNKVLKNNLNNCILKLYSKTSYQLIPDMNQLVFNQKTI